MNWIGHLKCVSGHLQPNSNNNSVPCRWGSSIFRQVMSAPEQPGCNFSNPPTSEFASPSQLRAKHPLGLWYLNLDGYILSSGFQPRLETRLANERVRIRKHPNLKLQTHGNAVMQTSVGLSGGSDLPLHVIIECLICIQRGWHRVPQSFWSLVSPFHPGESPALSLVDLPNRGSSNRFIHPIRQDAVEGVQLELLLLDIETGWVELLGWSNPPRCEKVGDNKKT